MTDHKIDVMNNAFQEKAELVSPEYCLEPEICEKLTFGPINPISNKRFLMLLNTTAYCSDIKDMCEHNDECKRKKNAEEMYQARVVNNGNS